jgi:hypothetical protein
LDPILAAVDAKGDQMDTVKPISVLYKENIPVVFTREYVKHTLLSKKVYTQGTTGLITRTHEGPLCGITHVDVRLPDGEFVREVPVDYFRA